MFTPPSQVKHRLDKPDRIRRVQPEELMSRYEGIGDDKRPRKRKAVTCGKRTKLGIQEFLANVFEANELLPRSKKLTNAALESMLLEEFAHHAPLVKKVKEGRDHIINYYRHRYNLGLLTGKSPPTISFRYNENGLAIEPRYGKRILTSEKRAEIIDKYRRKFREVQEQYNEPEQNSPGG